MGQQNNLELLYQWTDDGTVLNVEDDPGDNWVGNIYNEIWGCSRQSRIRCYWFDSRNAYF